MVHLFDPALPTVELRPGDPCAAFLALEEALLDYCEESEHPGFLTFWESTAYFVVLGYGKQVAAEVLEDECARMQIGIYRRSSGGGTVLQGPGCLNYSLILPSCAASELESITGANRFIMERTRTALQQLASGRLEVRGHTDLTVDGLKFSGNAQRRKRRCLLFHGSFLIDFDLEMISRLLKEPQVQPDYRSNRSHRDFITNFPVSRSAVRNALQSAWNTADVPSSKLQNDVWQRVNKLVQEKYSRDEWNLRV